MVQLGCARERIDEDLEQESLATIRAACVHAAATAAEAEQREQDASGRRRRRTGGSRGRVAGDGMREQRPAAAGGQRALTLTQPVIIRERRLCASCMSSRKRSPVPVSIFSAAVAARDAATAAAAAARDRDKVSG